VNWKEMTDEILMDIGRISAASLSFGNPARHIVGMVQWNRKTLARLLLQPSQFQIAGEGGITAGMSMIPEPPADWRPADIGWVPEHGRRADKGEHASRLLRGRRERLRRDVRFALRRRQD
jgi:hypothetical protein